MRRLHILFSLTYLRDRYAIPQELVGKIGVVEAVVQQAVSVQV